MANDAVFLISFTNTFKWLLLYWTILVGCALLTALLISKKSKVSRMVRVIYLLPNILPSAVIGLLFNFMFNPSVGLVNDVIKKLWDPDFALNWFQNVHTAFFTVTATTIFYGGVFTLIFCAEISAISQEVYESAEIDGVNKFQKHFYITLPLLKNIIGTTLILATVQCLRTFDVIYMTTMGGPGSETMNLPLLIYKTAMNNLNFGYANAMSLVTILIGMITIGLISRLMKVGDSHH